MQIGLIEKDPVHTKTAYWFMGLGSSNEIDKILVNTKMEDRYGFFPLKHKKIVKKSIREIENTDLDFILYGWEYIRRDGIPNTKNPCGVIFGGAKRWTFGGRNKEVLDNCNLGFKIACPADLTVFLDEKERPEKFRSLKNSLTEEQIKKIRPLMFIGSWGMSYPNIDRKLDIPISFYGSPTSLNRVLSVTILKEKYGNKFKGGFINRKFARCDEHGNDVSGGNKKAKKYIIDTIKRKEYLLLMRKSIINLCPSGLGNSSHRFVDILCMGGLCLTTTLEGLNYGVFSPHLDIHYVEYKEDCSDLIDKVEYYLNNYEETIKMGDRARAFMEDTYLQPDRMAREYIIKEFECLKK